MSVVDLAIARLQDIVLSCTDTTVNHAPDYPIEDATALPLAIAHITDGTGNQNNSSTTQLNLNISIDVHFARVNIKDAYTRIDKFIPEFLCRLGGDPTLNGTVDTIIFPVSFAVTPRTVGRHHNADGEFYRTDQNIRDANCHGVES